MKYKHLGSAEKAQRLPSFPNWTVRVGILEHLGSVTEDAICLGFTCSEKSMGACMRKIFQGFCKKFCLYPEKSIPTGMHLFQFLFLAKITPCQSSGTLCKPPS